MTLAYAVADRGRGTIDVINAGHPAPLLLRPGSEVAIVRADETMLLGAGRGTRGVVTLPYAPGDAVLLYTDGLIERRGEDTDAGMDRLIAAARGLGRAEDLTGAWPRWSRTCATPPGTTTSRPSSYAGRPEPRPVSRPPSPGPAGLPGCLDVGASVSAARRARAGWRRAGARASRGPGPRSAARRPGPPGAGPRPPPPHRRRRRGRRRGRRCGGPARRRRFVPVGPTEPPSCRSRSTSSVRSSSSAAGTSSCSLSRPTRSARPLRPTRRRPQKRHHPPCRHATARGRRRSGV